MITNRKEKNIAMSETYLDIKLYTIVRQISSFLSDVTISFSGGELTPAELVGILSHSYKSNSTHKNSTRYYEVKRCQN